MVTPFNVMVTPFNVMVTPFNVHVANSIYSSITLGARKMMRMYFTGHYSQVKCQLTE